jgi:hypothetical protein
MMTTVRAPSLCLGPSWPSFGPSPATVPFVIWGVDGGALCCLHADTLTFSLLSGYYESEGVDIKGPPEYDDFQVMFTMNSVTGIMRTAVKLNYERGPTRVCGCAPLQSVVGDV